MFDSIPDNLPVVGGDNENQSSKTAEVKPVEENLVTKSERPVPDILTYVPLDQDTQTHVNWKKWLLVVLLLVVVTAGGWLGWYGTVPFTKIVVFNPPWQLSAEKVAQYIIDDLTQAEHVNFSAVLSSDKFKVILDDQIPELNQTSIKISGDINFVAPFNSKIEMDAEHDEQALTKLIYQTVNGQSYLGGESSNDFYKLMFTTAGSAQIILPKQNSQPALTLTEVKDIYRENKFLIASDLERSTIDGQDYAMITLKSDLDKYQGFVQAIRDKKEVGLPYANNFDIIFSPQTTIKVAIRLSDKSLRSAFIDGVYPRLGKYNLSININDLNKNKLELVEPENVITLSSALTPPEPVAEVQADLPSRLVNVINSQSEVIRKLIGSNPQIPSDLTEDYSLDSDQDGLLDVIEVLIGTLANKSDSDGDGFQDLEEINNGYNPLGEGKLVFKEVVPVD